MRRTSVARFLTSVSIASFVVAGPLAPLAHAQQQAPPAEVVQAQPTAPAEVVQAQPTAPAEAVQVQPTAPPPPAQPDLFQEKLKGERATDRSQGFYNAEAVLVNVFLVPGRAITCAAGTIVGVTILAVSLGSGYRPATAMINEGCGGKWIVKGDDLRPDAPSSLVVTDPGR
jgi:hypothetical protein